MLKYDAIGEHNVSRGFSVSANLNAFRRTKDGKPTPESMMTVPFSAGISKNELRTTLSHIGRVYNADDHYNARAFMPGSSSFSKVEAPADGRTFRPEQFGEAFNSFAAGFGANAYSGCREFT